jgi:peptide/nickel transport system permease protein
MRAFLISRVLQLLVTAWVIVTVLFFLFRLGLPDPTLALISEGLAPEDRQRIIERFGLHLPLWQQYLVYLGNLVQGELGVSFYYKAPVGVVVFERLANTLVLMLPAILLAYTAGPLIGVLLVWKRGSGLESGGISLGLILRSAPVFWTGMLAIFAFGVTFGWLPTSGMRTLPYEAANWLDKVLTLDFLRHLMLPMLVIAAYYLALPMLIMRNTMLEVIGDDFIEFCEARGFSERRTMYRHAARNALLPVVTQAAVTTGLAVGGQVVVEVVFSWPGLGREMFHAVRTSDYPVAQATFVFLAGMVLAMNFIVDLVYSKLDPRVTHEAAKG